MYFPCAALYRPNIIFIIHCARFIMVCLVYQLPQTNNQIPPLYISGFLCIFFGVSKKKDVYFLFTERFMTFVKTQLSS